MKGRKPIPTRLKLMQGSRQYTKKQDRAEPKPTCSNDPKQTHKMNERETAIYDRLAKVLGGVGILTDADHDQFINYCQAQAALDEIRETVPMVTMPLKTLSIYKAALSTVMRIGTEFGFTPASRTKLTGGTSSAKSERDFDELIKPKKRQG